VKIVSGFVTFPKGFSFTLKGGFFLLPLKTFTTKAGLSYSFKGAVFR